MPRFAVCEFSTPRASFEQDVAAYAAAGVGGIGIAEAKLPAGRDAESVAKVRTSGLAVTACLPAVQSILPLPLVAGPADPSERVEAICGSVRRLAAFNPTTVVVITGPRGHYGAAEARRIAVEGLRRIATTAAETGVGVCLEPIHPAIRDDWTLVTTLPETVDLLDEAGVSDVGVLLDVWHLWGTPGFPDDLARDVDRIAGVHVCDRREPTRSWCDRVLPGDGVIDLPRVLRALVAAGYDGWYDLEVFSDDGTFGADYPDSLWKLPPAELARRGREAFERVWQAAQRGG